MHRLLGTVRDRVSAQLSTWVHSESSDYVDEALAFKVMGFRGHKLHPLTQLRRFDGANIPIEADIDLCRAVRSAVGQEVALFLDVSNDRAARRIRAS